ncbi:MAG: hypothetical protein QM802_04800 [Agriterribacter sp.]
MRLFLLIFMLPTVASLYGQKKDSDFLIDSIRKEMILFFINKGELDSELLNKQGNYTFAVEIHEKRILGYDSVGIYHVGVFTDHAKIHILIKEGMSFKLYDLSEIDIVLKAVIEYSLKHNLDKSLMLFYIKEIIALYEFNNTQGTENSVKKYPRLTG